MKKLSIHDTPEMITLRFECECARQQIDRTYSDFKSGNGTKEAWRKAVEKWHAKTEERRELWDEKWAEHKEETAPLFEHFEHMTQDLVDRGILNDPNRKLGFFKRLRNALSL